MGFEHNRLAYETNKMLLSQIQRNIAPWSSPRLTPATTYWQGISDYPRPDGAFEDKTTNASLAIEFKPPAQVKREYITGLGQALTYLRSFEFAALVVPKLANDGFAIAEYLKELLNEPFANALPIGLFAYDKDTSDSSDLKPLVNLRPRVGVLPGIPQGIGRKVFWGYWRDLSHYDVLAILAEIDIKSGTSFETAFQRFWRKYRVSGKAKTWEGRYRKSKTFPSPGFNAEKVNAFYALRHSGLVNSDGSLTETGHQLLHVGKIYCANSLAFTKYLGWQILDVGRHLELIFRIEEKQRIMPANRKISSPTFLRELDSQLYRAGIIPRIPDGAKTNFLRDEP